MKSKRKQVNKYKTKGDENPDEKEEDSLKRTTGNKPFQLNKLRVAKRHNLQSLAGKVNLDLLKKRLNQEDMLLEQGDVYLNLVIKKKLIIDNQNQKLQSERKSLIYLDYQKDLYSDVAGSLKGNNKTQEIEVDAKDDGVFVKHQSLDVFDGISHKKKGRKDQLQLPNGHQIKAIINHNNDHNFLNQFLAVDLNTPEAEIRPQLSQQESDTKMSATNRQFIPPQIFTTLKWRSKSQMLQVDKWKEKYGRPDYSKSIEKMKNQEQRSLVTFLQKKMQEEERKGKLIRFKNQRQHNLEKQGEKFASLPSIKQSASILKIDERRKSSQTDVLQNKNMIQTKVNDVRQHESKEKKVQKEIDDYNSTHGIVIKKMFNEEKIPAEEPEPVALTPQEQEIRVEKKQKRSKKNRFPEIKISTFYSTRETEDQKRKMLKMYNIQRSQHEWKEKPPKKIFLDKMMEEIPERWEYGESRESNRSEMNFYMRFKRDQEIRLQKEAEDQVINAQEGNGTSQLKSL